MSHRVKAVTVNHGTSHFVELMLRTLFYTNDLSGVDLEIVVLDNGSHDEHLEQLQTYLADQGIPMLQTGFDNSVAPQKHGVALTDFVLGNDNCTHYLFLDSDMWFVEEDTIPTMLTELVESPPDVFGCQAQIFGFYAHRIIERRGYAFDSRWHGEVERTFEDAHFELMLANRCSPVCSLITNTPVFRRVVDVIGLGRAAAFGVGGGAYYDTFGLMTHVMATHDLSFIVSSKRINHFRDDVRARATRAQGPGLPQAAAGTAGRAWDDVGPVLGLGLGQVVRDGMNRIMFQSLLAICKKYWVALTAFLVGKSGGGKSTLVRLLLHLLKPDSGRVLVDGQDLADVNLESFYREVAYIPQEPPAFDGTIRENLVFDERVDETKIAEAIAKTGLGELMDRLPDGLETVVGERGVKLSGGERQRLAFARVLVQDPRIVVLDEPTASLDSVTESFVTDHLTDFFRGRTVIVIAHRLQTVKGADKIVVLEDGAIIQEGGFDSLIAASGRFRQLWEEQTAGRLEEAGV